MAYTSGLCFNTLYIIILSNIHLLCSVLLVTHAQWARIPKNLAQNRFYEIKQLRRNLFPFVLTSSLVIAQAWTSPCLHIGHVCTAG